MTTPSIPTDVRAIIEHVAGQARSESHAATPDDLDRITLLELPKDRRVEDLTKVLDGYRPAPRFLVEAATLHTADSLIEYVKRFRTSMSALFADVEPDTAGIRAVLDYHGTAADDLPAAPSHKRHTARYGFPVSDEFKAWAEAAQEPLSQAEFAVFLQQREHDIANPPIDWMFLPPAEIDQLCDLLNLRDDHQPKDADGRPIPYEDALQARMDREDDPEGAELPRGYRTRLEKLREKRFGTQRQLEVLATEMSIRTSGKTAQRIDLQSGSRAIVFEDDNEAQVAGKRVKVPELFLIDIPMFVGEARRMLPVRLTYRRRGAEILWGLELVDARRLMRTAVEDVARRVAAATGCPLYVGRDG